MDCTGATFSQMLTYEEEVEDADEGRFPAAALRTLPDKGQHPDYYAKVSVSHYVLFVWWLWRGKRSAATRMLVDLIPLYVIGDPCGHTSPACAIICRNELLGTAPIPIDTGARQSTGVLFNLVLLD